MNSKARLTYTIVNKILNKNDLILKKEYEKSYNDLVNLQNLFKLLSKKREKRGAIDFDSTETSIVFQ